MISLAPWREPRREDIINRLSRQLMMHILC